MEVKEFVETVIDNFNMRLDTTKEEVRKEDGSFENAIENLRNSRAYIDALQHIVNQMKQEEHDLTQDVYNKFKNKGYVSTIKF
jgi:sulfatase maturation enzyme AslB (radical SAM superfamily)